jgi:hypothetical protein
MNRVRGRLGNVSMASEKILFSRPKVEFTPEPESTAATDAVALAATAATPAVAASASESANPPADTSVISVSAKTMTEVCEHYSLNFVLSCFSHFHMHFANCIDSCSVHRRAPVA